MKGEPPGPQGAGGFSHSAVRSSPSQALVAVGGTTGVAGWVEPLVLILTMGGPPRPCDTVSGPLGSVMVDSSGLRPDRSFG
jgi:hypothetical protein